MKDRTCPQTEDVREDKLSAALFSKMLNSASDFHTFPLLDLDI